MLAIIHMNDFLVINLQIFKRFLQSQFKELLDIVLQNYQT